MPKLLISGGSRGIGAACVRKFCESGYETAFIYRDSEEAARRIAEETGAHPLRADLSDADAVRAVAAAALEALGGAPDVLINNAAVSGFRLFTDIRYEEWRYFHAVNLDAPFLLTQTVLPAMISRKSGRIINISSMWGQVGASCEVHYSTTKAALIGMTRALAKELGPSGVTVNAIAPGLVDTDMNAALSAEDKAALCEETPLCRIGRPEEIADAALFLASDAASFITGQILGVNGGYVI